MVEAKDRATEGPAAPPPGDSDRVADATASLQSMMANPAAAMAAASAIGFAFTTQMAGAFIGAFQGAIEAGQKFAAAMETPKQAETGDDQPTETVDVPVAEETPQPVVPETVFPKVRAQRTAKPAPVPKAKAAPAKAPVRPVAKAAKAGTGDLKQIAGIGPKLEQVLQGMGIATLADIAGWTDADVARVDAELGFDGRIARDDWVGQAKILTVPKKTTKTTKS